MTTVPTFNLSQLKQLAQVVAERLNLYPGRGMLITKVDDGWTISTKADFEDLLLSRRTVALVGKPDPLPLDEQPPAPEPPGEPPAPLVIKPLTLTAREVRYRSMPPLAPDTQQPAVTDHLAGSNIVPGYEYGSGEFRVYPAIGFGVDDYEQYIVKPDGELDRTQTYLFAYRENNIWVLERPPGGGNVVPVVVRGVRADADKHVLVQTVTETDTDPWDGLMRPMGEAYEVATWCHQLARDYRAFITRQTTLTIDTPILHVANVNGTPRIVQDIRWDMIVPRGRIPNSDCIPEFTRGG